jgi:hypothetical protein
MRRHRTETRPVISALLILAMLAPPAPARQGADPGPQVVPPSPEYAKLSARWWQWALEQPVTPGHPKTTNPLVDTAGVAAHNGQPDDVFFLAGLLSINSGLVASADRTITVPKGTRFFFPLLNFEQDNVGVDPPLTVADLRKTAAFGVTQVETLFASVDGAEIPDLARYRTISPVFSYELPKNDVAEDRVNVAYYLTGGAIDVHGVQRPAVGDGFYILLKPLHPGRHTIRFGGTSQALDGDGNPATFQLDITYHITVRNR